MLPDRVSNPGPLTYESGALPIALRCPAYCPKRSIGYARSSLTSNRNSLARSKHTNTMKRYAPSGHTV